MFFIKKKKEIKPQYSILSVWSKDDAFGERDFLGHIKVENPYEYLGDTLIRGLVIAKSILGDQACYVDLDLMATNFPSRIKKLLN